MTIKVEFSCSNSRDGRFSYYDMKSAYDEAVRYVEAKNKEGISALAQILIYDDTLKGSVYVRSIPTGKYYSNGWSIPQPEGHEVEKYNNAILCVGDEVWFKDDEAYNKVQELLNQI